MSLSYLVSCYQLFLLLRIIIVGLQSVVLLLLLVLILVLALVLLLLTLPNGLTKIIDSMFPMRCVGCFGFLCGRCR